MRPNDKANSAKNLSGKASIGGLWAIAGKVGGKLVDLLTFIFLAHFLSPNDVGTVAIAMTWVMIVEAVLDLPLAAALLRFEQPTDAMFDTAFTLGALRGCLIAVTMVALAHPIAWFYNENALTALTIGLAFAPIMRGLVNPRLIIFAKRFDFRRDFAIDILGKSCALLTALTIAAIYQSPWAIAAATLTSPLVAMMLSYWFVPLRPRLTLSSWRYFSEIVGWHSLAQLISALNWQAERLMLPRFIDTAAFGQFAFAGDIASIPHQAIAQPLVKPVVAALAAQSSDEALRQFYIKLVGCYMLVLGPVFLVTGTLSDELLQFAFGDKWRGAAQILSWVALTNILTIPVVALAPLALRVNQVRFVTLRMAVECAVKIPLVAVGIYLMGIKGAIIAQAVSAAFILAVAIWSVKQMIALDLWTQIKTFARPALALAGAYGIYVALAHPVPDSADGLKLFTFILASGLTLTISFAILSILIWFACGRPDSAEATVISAVTGNGRFAAGTRLS
ncbi:oligosaccharide flippase family protein [Rhizobium sp. 18055]|uniref:oligosaccharide flippase family protein n=1 Tax=Rhizobium sp. 18055 TaxID=2681403 RepID=UPI00135B5C85|nr:oligosaccharide flippase family protein [Rhizobium sp. 18055]